MADLSSTGLGSHTMTPNPDLTPRPTFFGLLTTTTTYPWKEDEHDAQMPTLVMVIVVIFCGVCALLLVAFFYAFCICRSIQTPPKDSAIRRSFEREDATFRRSSSGGLTLGDVV